MSVEVGQLNRNYQNMTSQVLKNACFWIDPFLSVTTIHLFILFWDKTNFCDFHQFLMRIFGMDELHGFFLRLCSIWQIFAHSSNYWHQSIFVVSAVKFQCRSLKKYKSYTQYSPPYSYLFKFLTPHSTMDANLGKEVLPMA